MNYPEVTDVQESSPAVAKSEEAQASHFLGTSVFPL
jgi:hypothetical protein